MQSWPLEGRPCSTCRARHVSCDRGRPCSRCVEAGFTCTDPPQPARKRGRPTSAASANRQPLSSAVPLILPNPMPSAQRPHKMPRVSPDEADGRERGQGTTRDIHTTPRHGAGGARTDSGGEETALLRDILAELRSLRQVCTDLGQRMAHLSEKQEEMERNMQKLLTSNTPETSTTSSPVSMPESSPESAGPISSSDQASSSRFPQFLFCPKFHTSLSATRALGASLRPYDSPMPMHASTASILPPTLNCPSSVDITQTAIVAILPEANLMGSFNKPWAIERMAPNSEVYLPKHTFPLASTEKLFGDRGKPLIIAADEQFRSIFKYSSDELHGTNCFRLHPTFLHDTLARWYKQWDQLGPNDVGPVYVATCPMVDRDGNILYVLSRTQAFYDRHGQYTWSISIMDSWQYAADPQSSSSNQVSTITQATPAPPERHNVDVTDLLDDYHTPAALEAIYSQFLHEEH